MGNFAEELKKAAEGLEKFNEKLNKVSGGGSGTDGGTAVDARFASGSRVPSAGGGGLSGLIGGVSGKGGSFLAAGGAAGAGLAVAGAAVEAAKDVTRFFTPAANAYAVTGTSQGFASAVTNSVLGAAENTALGGYILAATGISAARGTNQRAGASTLSSTEDFARLGIAVSDEDRKAIFDIAQEQEKRVTEERGKVEALANSADALSGAKPSGAGEGFDAILSVLRSIENKISGFGGGKP